MTRAINTTGGGAEVYYPMIMIPDWLSHIMDGMRVQVNRPAGMRAPGAQAGGLYLGIRGTYLSSPDLANPGTATPRLEVKLPWHVLPCF